MADATDRAQEIQRIRADYEARDAAAGPVTSPDLAWLGYQQALEWHLLRELEAAGAMLAGAQVLDVGTGAGFYLGRLVEYGAAAGVGVELMENRVAEARRRRPHLDVRQGDASELPFENASFDLVTQFGCLNSVFDDGVRTAIAAEMWRVLRPGGAIVSYDLRPAPTPIRQLGSLARRRPGAPLWTPVITIDEAELRRLWPRGTMRVRSCTLNVALPRALRRRRAVAMALEAVPALRSHLLAIVRKPA